MEKNIIMQCLLFLEDGSRYNLKELASKIGCTWELFNNLIISLKNDGYIGYDSDFNLSTTRKGKELLIKNNALSSKELSVNRIETSTSIYCPKNFLPNKRI